MKREFNPLKLMTIVPGDGWFLKTLRSLTQGVEASSPLLHHRTGTRRPWLSTKVPATSRDIILGERSGGVLGAALAKGQERQQTKATEERGSSRLPGPLIHANTRREGKPYPVTISTPYGPSRLEDIRLVRWRPYPITLDPTETRLDLRTCNRKQWLFSKDSWKKPPIGGTPWRAI
ncbi:hypothetical protein AAG570_010277 [Ranatra chinensis]|uniref:Uncharacterized protein n=1 Tax=Ranatra chinensis TaxID=642074 RepID=A0ABD0YMH2_9HEMI